jgi:flagellar basal-body rod protein FlgB
LEEQEVRVNVNLNLLKKSLDGLWLRQQTTMENIANYSTPGYKSKTVDFETILSANLKSTYGKTTSEINEQILSGNIIIKENDNLQLAKTQIQYMYTVAEINSYFSKLKSVISEGKK